MTPHPRPKLVDSAVLIPTTLLSLLCVCGSLLILTATDDSQLRQSAFGQTLADNLASMSLGAFVAQDKIQLGILSNRTAQQDAVIAVTIFGADGTVLAMAGNIDAATPPAGRLPSTSVDPNLYRAPVRLDNADIGAVRIVLAPSTLASVPTPTHWLLSLGLALVLPWLILAGVAALQRARLRATAARADKASTIGKALGAKSATNDRVASIHFEAEEHFLVLANLVCHASRLGEASAAGAAAQAQAVAWGHQVAHLYGGRVTSVGTAAAPAVALTFANQFTEDQAFSVIYAALLWSRCLADDEQVPGFRLGLHLAPGVQGGTGIDDGLIDDVRLLSAAVSDGRLILTHSVHHQLQRPERVTLSTFAHPLADELNSAQGELFVVQGLSDPYLDLLDEQHQRLQASSTESLSTF